MRITYSQEATSSSPQQITYSQRLLVALLNRLHTAKRLPVALLNIDKYNNIVNNTKEYNHNRIIITSCENIDDDLIFSV